MGIFDVFKKSRREVNRDNQHQGKSGEEQIRQKYEINGYKVERTGRGHDLRAKRQNWLTGKKETKYIEVKTGNSSLSKLQKKKKRQFGSKYIVERLEPTPFGFVPKSPSKKHMSSKNSSSLNILFGSGKRSTSKKRKSSGYDALFGTSSSNKRSRSSSYDALFGSTSSRRIKSRSTYNNI